MNNETIAPNNENIQEQPNENNNLNEQSKKKWLPLAIVGVVVVLLIGGIFLTGNQQDEDGMVKVGVIAPLTGWAAFWGEDIRKSVDMAVEEINDAGGINGRKIAVIYEDFGSTDLKAATNAANKLVNVDNVDILVTTFLEDTVVASPIAHKGGKTMISIAAGNVGVTPDDMLFRVRPYVEGLFPEVSVNYFSSKAYVKPVVLYEQLPYYINYKDETVNAWSSFVGDEVPAIEIVGDVRGVLAEVKSKNYDLVYVRAPSPTQIEIIKRAKELGITAIIEGTEAFDPVFIDAGEVTDGLVYVDYKGHDANLFVENFEEKYSKTPGIPAFLAYDTIYAISHGITDNNSNAKGILSGLKDVKFEGVTGIVEFDENQNRVIEKSRAEILIKEDGVFVPIQ